MCGIVGFSGGVSATEKIVKGLSVLEYRGYDSCGIAGIDKNQQNVVKCRGRVENLREKLADVGFCDTHCAIGHTRWATHGAPTDINAHPHSAKNLVLVHNGIIENYRQLKTKLKRDGVNFLSETDTEVAGTVISKEYDVLKDPVKAIYSALSKFEGSYAFAIIFNDYPNNIYAVRKGSPLILGNGADGKYCASDITALLPFTNDFCYLEEGKVAVLTAKCVSIITADLSEKTPLWQKSDITVTSAQKCGFKHFMLKEINEQPDAFTKTVAPRIKDGLPDFCDDGIDDTLLKNVRNIHIVACGSAMHAGLVGKRIIESTARIPVDVEIASEYRYNNPIISENTLIIVVSQSGETADTLAALRYAKAQGATVVGIVNAVGSTIAREADATVYTFAGPEIAVATTKGYCVQVAVLALLGNALALKQGKKTEEEVKTFCRQFLEKTPDAISKTIDMHAKIKQIAKAYYNSGNIFFIGRGIDYALCLEGSLKLKEISYIHSEAYPAGELKHGTISLIEKGTPVIALCTDVSLYDKTVSNIRECASRGADVLLICSESVNLPESVANRVIKLPNCENCAQIFSAIVAMQLIAYEVAQLRNCDIDKPRNLAKSVTVE